MAQRVVDYSDFSGGEYGVLEPWRAPPGTWTGKNIVQYDNGSLGPRNGMVEINLSAGITGNVLSAGPYSRRTDSSIWLIVDNAGTRSVKTITAAGVVSNVTAVDAVPAATEPIMSLVYEDIEYLSIVSNGLYKITGGNFTKLPTGVGAGSPGCRSFIQHGDRFFAGGGDTGGVPKAPEGRRAPPTACGTASRPSRPTGLCSTTST